MREINEQSLKAAARVNFTQQAQKLAGDDYVPTPWNKLLNGERRFYIEDAQAIIAAYLAAEAERGYALVPREPTPEMIVAGVAERHGQPVPEAWSLATQNIWREMFDAAAPIKPSEKEG